MFIDADKEGEIVPPLTDLQNNVRIFFIEPTRSHFDQCHIRRLVTAANILNYYETGLNSLFSKSASLEPIDAFFNPKMRPTLHSRLIKNVKTPK